MLLSRLLYIPPDTVDRDVAKDTHVLGEATNRSARTVKVLFFTASRKLEENKSHEMYFAFKPFAFKQKGQHCMYYYYFFKPYVLLPA